MQLFKSGPYEEFVGRLSSAHVRPEAGTWDAISRQLDQYDLHRKRIAFKRLYVAASIILIIGLGLSSLLLVDKTFSIEELATVSNVKTSTYSISSKQSLYEIGEIALPEALNSTKAPMLPVQLASEKIERRTAVGFNDTQDGVERLNKMSGLPAALPVRKKQYNEMPHLPSKGKQGFSAAQKDINESVGKEETGSNGAWSIVAFANPSYSSHTTAALNFNQNPIETGAWMLGGELLVKREFNKYFALYSGFLFSPVGQEANNLLLLRSNSKYYDMTKLQATTSLGIVSLSNSQVGVSDFSTLSSASEKVLGASTIDKAELTQRFYFMEIPLIVSAGFTRGPLNIEVKIGCAAGVIIDNKFDLRTDNGNFIGRTENVRHHNASALGAVGISFPVNNQLSLMVEPNLRLTLKPLSYSYTTTYPFTASVKFGMGYRF